MHIRILLALPLLYILTLTTACSFAVEQEKTTETNDMPDIVLFKSNIHVVDDTDVHIKAEKIEIYSSLSKQIFNNVYFEQFDEDDEMTMNGTANAIIMNDDSNNIEISGNIDITLLKDESRVQGNYLFWDSEKDLLTSKDADLITISRDNGTSITGTGFSVNTLKQVINYAGPTSGVIHTGDAPEPAPADAANTDAADPTDIADSDTPSPTTPSPEEKEAEREAERLEKERLEEEINKEQK